MKNKQNAKDKVYIVLEHVGPDTRIVKLYKDPTTAVNHYSGLLYRKEKLMRLNPSIDYSSLKYSLIKKSVN